MTAIRGSALSFTGDPFLHPLEDCLVYESDAIVAMEEGQIAAFGPASELAERYPDAIRYENALILPGFIDAHVHYPQTAIIGSPGKDLIDWLDTYTFASEQRFADPDYARDAARVFLRECLRAGTTSAGVYCTVHADSVEAFFAESDRLNMRNIAGRVLMDRHAPEALLDDPQTAHDESKSLIERWHENGRQLYGITPRFAPTSSPEQMEMTCALWSEHPGTYLQSHVSENRGEVAWAQELYPDRSGYLDIYDHYGQLGPRSVLAHGIHLSEGELARCHETGTAIAHCPTSNLFLGSGVFHLENVLCEDRPVRVGLATDVGAGTSLSMLQTLNETYKIAQLSGFRLDARQAFYLATRGTARALYLADRIGSIAPGMEADLVVLDLRSTPLIDYRMQHCDSLEEALFVQMTLGDDRAVRATWVAGRCLHDREADGDE